MCLCSNFIYFVFLMCIVGSSQDCVLPPHPAHGKHASHEFDRPQNTSPASVYGERPGSPVPELWILEVQCDPGYMVDQAEYAASVCQGGQWTPPLLSCHYDAQTDPNACRLPGQPSNGKYSLLAAECGTSEEKVGGFSPGQPVPTDCVLDYSCDEGYVLRDSAYMLVTCDNSTWSPSPSSIQCIPNLGSDLQNTTTASPHVASECSPPEAPNTLFCPYHCQECTPLHRSGCASTDQGHRQGQLLKVQCAPGYGFSHAEPHTLIGCQDGAWVPKIPKCLKLCPALESESLIISCAYGASQISCSKPMIPGTTATHRCRPSHKEYPGLGRTGMYRRILSCRNGGSWSHWLPECEPHCGFSRGNFSISPTIIDGKATELGVFPWHVGLYRRDLNSFSDEEWKNVCGGSLISTRIVLTAAHCVSASEPANIRVMLGKQYRSWYHEEQQAVTRSISAIRLPQEYSGAVTSYVWDVALLLLNGSVPISSFIMPVCRNVDTTSAVIRDNTIGYVVGWGLSTAEGQETEMLLHTQISLLTRDSCRGQMPRVLTFDKFCGQTNSSGAGIAKGDSGGGLTVVINNLHYIFGISSIKYNEIAAFTDVSWETHRRWIDNEINRLEL